MNADGSGQARLTLNVFLDAQPAWSPDGTMIAFSAGVANNAREIFIMSADGSGIRQVLSESIGDPADPAWSPDGRKIAFGAEDCGFYGYGPCSFLIRVVSTDGMYSLTISDTSEPSWRP